MLGKFCFKRLQKGYILRGVKVARTLDKTRPYGKVFGTDLARYEQDGHKFNEHGNEITGDTSLAPNILPRTSVTNKPSESEKRRKQKARVSHTAFLPLNPIFQRVLQTELSNLRRVPNKHEKCSFCWNQLRIQIFENLSKEFRLRSELVSSGEHFSLAGQVRDLYWMFFWPGRTFAQYKAGVKIFIDRSFQNTDLPVLFLNDDQWLMSLAVMTTRPVKQLFMKSEKDLRKANRELLAKFIEYITDDDSDGDPTSLIDSVNVTFDSKVQRERFRIFNARLTEILNKALECGDSKSQGYIGVLHHLLGFGIGEEDQISTRIRRDFFRHGLQIINKFRRENHK